MSKKAKIFIGVVVVAGLAFAANSFLGSDTPPASTQNNPLSSTTGMIPLPGAPTVNTTSADEFSKVLSTIKSITIDTSLFQNRAYMMLRDFPVSLGTDIAGRVNPFAPIGSDASTPVVETAVIQTLQAGKINKTGAELGAQITVTQGIQTTVVFEYGTTDTFGSATNPITVSKSGTVLSTITGLTPGTTYYTRAVAIIGASTTTANTTSFVTTK